MAWQVSLLLLTTHNTEMYNSPGSSHEPYGIHRSGCTAYCVWFALQSCLTLSAGLDRQQSSKYSKVMWIDECLIGHRPCPRIPASSWAQNLTNNRSLLFEQMFLQATANG